MEEDDGSMGDDLFPEINVEVCDPNNSRNCDNIYLGGDRYRGANFINVESDFFTFKGTYDAGESEYTFGYEREETDVYNLFIARYNLRENYSPCYDMRAPKDFIQHVVYRVVSHPIYLSNLIYHLFFRYVNYRFF